MGEAPTLRLWARYFDRSASPDTKSANPSDDWSVTRAGARLDWAPGKSDRFALHAGLYDGEIGQTLQLTTQLTPPYTSTFATRSKIAGGHLMGRWQRQQDSGADLALQIYYDHSHRSDELALTGTIDIVDVDFQQRRQANGHGLTWGLGYRLVRDQTDDSFAISVTPANRTTHLWSGFVQTDISLQPERLGLALGSKAEHNSYTGFEAQPSARLWWKPAPRHLIWGAVSRAVRTPARSDDDMEYAIQILPSTDPNSAVPTLLTLAGNRQFDSENLLAFEAGYRAQAHAALILDATLFYNRYDDLRASEPGAPRRRDTPAPTHDYLPFSIDNKGRGKTFGVETAATWQIDHNLRLTATYAYLQMDLTVDDSSRDLLFSTQER